MCMAKDSIWLISFLILFSMFSEISCALFTLKNFLVFTFTFPKMKGPDLLNFKFSKSSTPAIEPIIFLILFSISLLGLTSIKAKTESFAVNIPTFRTRREKSIVIIPST